LGDAALRLPAIHLVFGLVKRWLLGTHHGAVGEKHLAAYLDEFVFRFNRRTARSLSHRFARLIKLYPSQHTLVGAGAATASNRCRGRTWSATWRHCARAASA